MHVEIASQERIDELKDKVNTQSLSGTCFWILDRALISRIMWYNLLLRCHLRLWFQSRKLGSTAIAPYIIRSHGFHAKIPPCFQMSRNKRGIFVKSRPNPARCRKTGGIFANPCDATNIVQNEKETSRTDTTGKTWGGFSSQVCCLSAGEQGLKTTFRAYQ